jgi:hypothetical protein
MARRRPTVSLPISDITKTTEAQIWVIDAASGIEVKLPRSGIDFVPGRVVMAWWIYQKIWRPTLEKGAPNDVKRLA